MASAVNKLSVAKIARASEPGLYGDGGGLYLQVSKWGTKSWLLRFTLDGKARYMGLGSCDVFTLAEARERARAARQLLADGIDPIEQRRRKRVASRAEAAKRMTLREAAERYIAAHKASWSGKHAAQWASSLEQHVFPLIGGIDVAAIDTAHVLKVIEPLWAERTETANRIRNRIEIVLDWARARHYRSGENPARWRGHLDKVLPAPRKVAKVKHLAALAIDEVPVFMRRLRGEDSIPCRALEFTILTAVRTRETLDGVWAEVDLEKAIWTIGAARMKAAREHRVPLSGRALELLRSLPQGDAGTLIFPSRRGRPLKQAAMLEALHAMGVEATVHGFRSAFRDWVGERSNFPGELAEAALAHAVGDATERAYRRGDAIEKRRKLMEAWARYCAEKPAEGGKVVPMQGRA